MEELYFGDWQLLLLQISVNQKVAPLFILPPCCSYLSCLLWHTHASIGQALKNNELPSITISMFWKKHSSFMSSDHQMHRCQNLLQKILKHFVIIIRWEIITLLFIISKLPSQKKLSFVIHIFIELNKMHNFIIAHGSIGNHNRVITKYSCH